MSDRIYLSPPHMGENELRYVQDAFSTNWIAPVGPHLSTFEEHFSKRVGSKYSVAVTSGTAALHMALRYAGVGPGDEVLCSTLTFIASASPITYLGAYPVFIDSDHLSWNIDPILLEKVLTERAIKNSLPKAIVITHLYGQCAAMELIVRVCDKYNVIVVEDSAEALGATYKGKSPGTFGQSGIFSFNGNKIITTSGGGMLVTDNKVLADKVRFWSTQAKEPVGHYEHKEIGYNYRLSNISAAIGIGQLEVLTERVQRKREIYDSYVRALGELPGITFMPEPAGCFSTRWLTCMVIDPELFGCDNQTVLKHLADKNIEARLIWKPLHLQPVFTKMLHYGGEVAETLYRDGLCLPSGTAYTDEDFSTIHAIIKGCYRSS